MARRRSRGLGGVAHSPASLKTQASACGTPYFSPGSMRFFNARLLSTYPVPNKDMTYFVEAKGGGRAFGGIGRHYTIGVFKNCKVESIGQGVGRGNQKGAYKSAAAAKKVAKALATKASGGGATLKKKRRSRR